MLAGATNEGVCLLEFDAGRAGRATAELRRLLARGPDPRSAAAARWLDQLRAELDAYFAGRTPRFSVPLVTPGTDFERSVWAHLCTIPPGQTRSYGHVAAALGDPGASRAVGRANGRNRIAIVIPCHRVVETGGGLGGYGGGLDRKRWLLGHERRWADGVLF
jgi:O-6-methylguanine DNA methyltransferase